MIPTQPSITPKQLRRWGVVTLVVVLVLALGFYLSDVFNPLLLGLLLAYILNPVVEALEKRHISRQVAVPVLFGVMLLVILGVTGFATVKGAERLIALKDRVAGERVLDPTDPDDAALLATHTALQSGQPPPADAKEEHVERARRIAHDGQEAFVDHDGDGKRKVGLAEKIGVLAASELKALGPSKDVFKQIARGFEGHAQEFADWGIKLSQSAKSSLSKVTDFFNYVLLVPLYAFFLLHSFTAIKQTVRDHLPAATRPQVIAIATKIDKQVAAFFRGSLMLALTKGLATAIGLWIAGVPFAFFIGMGAGILSLVPLLGPIVAGGISIVVAYTGPEGFVLQVVWILLALGAAEVVEAIARPLIMGAEVGLSPLTLILSFFVFGKLLGTFGLLLAVPIASVVKTLFLELALPEIEALAQDDEEGGGATLSADVAPAIPTFGGGA